MIYADDWLTVYAGDCREVLATLPAESVHCVVTSPPYWGLRDYGTATWDGGDPDCDHTVSNPDADNKAVFAERVHRGDRTICRKCGATRVDNQLGLEPTPEQYVENMVAVFREVRRVLRNDGTLWLNLGDSYASGTGGDRSVAGDGRADPGKARARSRVESLKPKDLVGIPWRVAFALQADGWYLRSDIIWSKPNPMPESVTDRPTKSHEYVFLFAKSPRYYFDADAVRESATNGERFHGDYGKPGVLRPTSDRNGRHDPDNTTSGRNIRSVWTIPTQPYPGAHFAVFPPKLVEPCIKAGCPVLGTVLDPFAGSGTVGMVAQNLSRRAVLIDLNPDYIKQQFERNAALPLGLTV